jgi:hypothetical protein
MSREANVVAYTLAAGDHLVVAASTTRGTVGLSVQHCSSTLLALVITFAVGCRTSSDPCILPSWMALPELDEQQALNLEVRAMQKFPSLEVVYHHLGETFIYSNISITIFQPLVPLVANRFLQSAQHLSLGVSYYAAAYL